MRTIELALEFVERINARDVQGLTALMSEDHRFIDATGAVHGPRETMRAGWAQYFDAFPDYRIEIERSVGAADGECAALFGVASGSFKADASKAWRLPAAWLAVVRDERVVEWRVYCDVEPMLRSMGITRQT